MTISGRITRLVALAGVLGAIAAPAHAQSIVACPAQQDTLLSMPEIASVGGKLKATLKLSDTLRTIWGSAGDPRCATQRIRFLQGWASGGSAPPVRSEPMPGPTFRAKLGDLVEIAFFNQVNTSQFSSTLDRGAVGSTPACDNFTTANSSTASTYGTPQGDQMPNCLHGSSTTNVHFHGTHTTPSTTGDNVVQFIRPANRTNGKLRPADEKTAMDAFKSIFSTCEQKGPPTAWSQLPTVWRNAQRDLMKEYDRTAPYQGKVGALPDSSKLWPYDSLQIATGIWPQYQIGAYPYCFPLPKYDPNTMKMGQSPGTHWYHAHKHGSTALNVANALHGVFIITGAYDSTLKAYYGSTFREQTLMIQQIGTAPFPLTNPLTTGPGSVGRPVLSINGRINPVVSIRPGWDPLESTCRHASLSIL